MSDHDTRNVLDDATAALRDVPVPGGPPAELLAATVRAIDHRPAGAAPAGPPRRKRIMRYAGYATAAVAVATLVGLLGFGGGSAAARVQKALDNAAKAKSVKVTAMLINVETEGKMTHVQTMFRQGDVVRIETVWAPPEMPVKPVTVADLKTRKALILLPQAKTAQRGTLGAEESQGMAAMMGNFAEMKAQLTGGDDKAVKAVGEERIGGRWTKAYEITVKDSKVARPGVWTVWVDPETELPVRLADAHRGLILDFEDWNKEFDPKLFSLDVPAGYKEVEQPGATPARLVPALLTRALDNATKAKSVRLVFTREYDGKTDPMMTVHVQDGRSRWEGRKKDEDFTLLIDVAARQGLSLNHTDKTAEREALAGDRLTDARKQHEVFFNPLSVLRDTKDMTVKALDGEKIGGRPMKVFMLTHPGNDEHAAMTGFLWIDEKTDLPARLKLVGDALATEDANGPKADTVIEFEDWNKEFDPKLFKLDVPAGYKLTENDKKD
jgi:outer membrane lipoprotein-sorting protein